MDNVVTVYHGGSVEEDEFGNVRSFVGMQRVSLIFDDRPLLSELLGRTREELHCNSNEGDISVQGILHFGKSGLTFRRLVSIASEGEWEKYVKTVMKNEFQCLDLVVRKFPNDPIPIGHSPLSGFLPEQENLAPFGPVLANGEVEVADVVVVPDAQSAPNEVGICPGAHSAPTERRVFPELGTNFGGSGRAKRQRMDELDDRCKAVALDAVLVDRISALPDELRLRVLTHLPLRDAIRTGALARGWRDLWRGRWAHRASLEVHIYSHNAKQRVLGTLAQAPRRRLERFSLRIRTSIFKASELRRFLDYATECGVEDLHVRTSCLADTLKFHLPLSCPALACLSLRSISISTMYYKGAQPFLALVVIRLVSVSCARDAFKKMMALCPNLLTLDLRSCRCNGDDRDGWKFDRLPPNLRSLAIADCDRITSLDFVRVPTLRSFRYMGLFSNLPLSIPRDAMLSDLYIQLDESVSMKQWMKEQNIDKLRKSLPTDLSSLNVLTICYRTLHASVLPANGDSAQLPKFNLHSLKELHLLMFEMRAVNLSNLYLFLKTFQCPNLERLFVELPTCRDDPIEGSIDQVWEEPPEDGLDNLVMVKVMNFSWCPTEVQLVSFLLRKASSLQKLLMVSRNVTPVDLPGAPEADLLLLKQAWVNGKIILTESDNATQPYHEAFGRYYSYF